MSEDTDKKEKLILIIDYLHTAAHNGAFDNVDEDVITSLSDFFRNFLDIKVTSAQAAKVLSKPHHTINNIVYRKLPKAERYKNYWLIKLSSLSKFFT